MKRNAKHPHHVQHTHPEGWDEAHHGSVSPEYGQRYPKGASAVESHTDRGVYTQVQTHRDYLKHQQEIFGDVLPDIHGDSKDLLLNMFSELLYVTKKLYKLQRAQVPQGKTYMYSFNLKTTDFNTHIDFVDPASTMVRIPAGLNFNVPQTKLFSIHVYNDGPGTLSFQTNMMLNEFETTETLKPGEDKDFSYNWPLIRTLNIVATGTSSVNVRVITMY